MNEASHAQSYRAAGRPQPRAQSRRRRSTSRGSSASASTPARSSGARRALAARRSVKKEYQAAWLVQALTCLDLTTLAGDDTPGRVHRLCAKARRPLDEDILEALGLSDSPPTVGAVCVYPTMVGPAVKALAGSGIPVASVADRLSRRPDAAQAAPRRNRLRRRARAPARSTSSSPAPMCSIANGRALYDEVKAMREACGAAHLKTILATGDLKTLRNVYARQHGRDAGGRRFHQDLHRQGGRQRHACPSAW